MATCRSDTARLRVWGPSTRMRMLPQRDIGSRTRVARPNQGRVGPNLQVDRRTSEERSRGRDGQRRARRWRRRRPQAARASSRPPNGNRQTHSTTTTRRGQSGAHFFEMEGDEETVIPDTGRNSLISRELLAAACPFGVHHGVWSEEWSADGFTRVTAQESCHGSVVNPGLVAASLTTPEPSGRGDRAGWPPPSPER